MSLHIVKRIKRFGENTKLLYYEKMLQVRDNLAPGEKTVGQINFDSFPHLTPISFIMNVNSLRVKLQCEN